MRAKYTILSLILGLTTVLFFLLVGSRAQQLPQDTAQMPHQSKILQQIDAPKYMKEGNIQHKVGSAVVTANDPRPLLQAIKAVREEYGWLVSYEDPPYTTELINLVNPKFKITHPESKGTLIPAGGAFQVQYNENSATRTGMGQENLLKLLVSEYNKSGNPGKFIVRKEGDDRFSIVGKSIKDQNGKDKSISSILDTPVSINLQIRTAGETIELILKELSEKSGVNVDTPYTLRNITDQVEVGGKDVSARTLLLQTFKATKRPFIYSLLFDADNAGYFLNLSIATQSVSDTYGRKSNIPIDRNR